jgi:hypothetical protein
MASGGIGFFADRFAKQSSGKVADAAAVLAAVGR